MVAWRADDAEGVAARGVGDAVPPKEKDGSAPEPLKWLKAGDTGIALYTPPVAFQTEGVSAQGPLWRRATSCHHLSSPMFTCRSVNTEDKLELPQDYRVIIRTNGLGVLEKVEATVSLS